MSFLYFMPGSKSKPTPEAIEAADLAYAFDKLPEFWGCDHGPDGQPGVVLAVGSAQRYKPEVQDWQAMPGNQAGVWIGIPKGKAIGPAELLRKDTLPGHAIELGDGNHWLTPVIRAAVPESGNPFAFAINLPQRSTRDETGQWVPGPVLDRYRPLWDLATTWHDHYFATGADDAEQDTDDPFEGDDAFDKAHAAAITVLSANYRIGPAEADLLGLLTSQNVADVLNSTIDIPTRLLIVAANRKATEETPAA